MFSIEVLDQGKGQKIPVNGEVVVGQLGADLVLQSSKVDHKHCSFFIEGEVLALIDHGSKAGTFIEGNRLQAQKMALLNDGDVVQVGDISILVHDSNSKPKIVNENAGKELSLNDLGLEEETRLGQLEKLERADIEAEELSLEDSRAREETDLRDSTAPELPSRGDFELEMEDSLNVELEERPLFLGKHKHVDEVTQSDNLKLETQTDAQIDSSESTQTESEVSVVRLIHREQLAEEKTSQALLAKGRASTTSKLLRGKKRATGSLRAKQKNKQKMRRTIRQLHRVGVLGRFLAIIGDLAIIQIVHTIANNFEGYRTLYADMNNLVGGGELLKFFASIHERYLFGFFAPVVDWVGSSAAGPLIQQTLHDYAPMILGYFVLRFVSNLIFGVSLAQLSLGMGGQSSFIWNRVGSALRSALEFILLPLAFMDIVCVFKKLTLKERLSFTGLKERSRTQKVIGTFIFMPLLIGFSITLPLLRHLEFKEGLLVQETRVKPTISSKIKRLDRFQWDSPTLHVKAEYNNAHKFSLIPSFDIVQSESGRRVYPKLVLFHLERKVVGVWKVGPASHLYDWLHLFSSRYRLMEQNYFELSKVIQEGRSKYRPIELNEFNKMKQKHQNYTLLSKQAKKEIHEIVKSSFQIGLNNILEHIQTHGPFIDGFVSLREKFFELVDFGLDYEFQMEILGNYKFLKIQAKTKQVKQGRRKILYIPLDTLNGQIFEFQWDQGPAGHQAHLEFVRHFLARASWTYDLKWKLAELESLEQVNLLSALEYFLDAHTSLAGMSLVEEFLGDWYFLESQKMMRKAGGVEQTLLLDNNMARVITVAKGLKREDYDPTAFIKRLNAIRMAIKENKPEYFELQ